MSDFDNAKIQPKSEDFVKEIEVMNDELKVMEEARESRQQFYLKGDHTENKLTDVGTGSVADFNHTYHINPGVKQKPELRDEKVLLSVRHLKQFFFFGKGAKRTKLKAVSNVSFDVHEGECVGVVRESGCGKTTTGRSIIRLYDITSGSIYYKGVRISAGERWNRKEIKYTKIRAKQNI